MKIAIVCGGNSFEHEISIVSAISIKNILKEELIFIFLDKDREFYLIEKNNMKSNFFSSGKYKNSKKLHLDSKGFNKKSLLSNRKIVFDVLINLVHGRDGEDGKLSSLFELYNIPFIGPRPEASVVSYNKFLTKCYAKSLNIDVLDYQTMHISDKDKKCNIKLPVIIKPLRLGSSLGVSVVNKQDELDYAFDVAFEFDDDILIEPFIKQVKEYNLAGLKSNEFIFSIIEEPKKDTFLDFDKKYLDFSRTTLVNRANLSEDLELKIKNTFKIIYNNMFNGAIIRCDFFIINNKVFLNEINPIPGSMANYLFNDFNNVVKELANNLPRDKHIEINYKYINSIQKAKGK
jgi:D-alanine-D-alanine ligase